MWEQRRSDNWAWAIIEDAFDLMPKPGAARRASRPGAEATSEDTALTEEADVEAICGDCGTHMGGEVAASRVKWVKCQSCRASARDGVTQIAVERKRQKAVEGWTPEHDDEHDNGEMATAAAFYITHDNRGDPPVGWPWSREWWKPKDRVRNLVRAGALIAAEIDRLQRAARSSSGRPAPEEGR